MKHTEKERNLYNVRSKTFFRRRETEMFINFISVFICYILLKEDTTNDT